MKYICEHCKEQVTDSQKFCHECGSQLEQLSDKKGLYEVRNLSDNDIVYGNVVFMQGDEADDILDLYDDKGLDSLYDYLLEWDTGEYNPVYEELPSGSNDKDINLDEHVISINKDIPYVGMVRKINKEVFIDRYGKDQLE